MSNDISPLAAPLNTGLTFAQGAALVITASGSWNIGGGQPSFGRDGTSFFGNGLPGIQYETLIAKVGATGAFNAGLDWFKVGSSFAGAAPSSSTLFFAFLDQDAANNSGFVTAVVGVPVAAIPEPVTYVLMLFGLSAVSLVARHGGAKKSLKG